jgi:hypothetical protein
MMGAIGGRDEPHDGRRRTDPIRAIVTVGDGQIAMYPP